MKMKKLTALALAGALCLGMSTTAFAASSPTPADAVSAINDPENRNVTASASNEEMFATWTDSDPNKASQNIVKSFSNELDKINDILSDKEYVNSLNPEQITALENQRDTFEELANPDVIYEVATTMDLTSDGVVDENHPLTVRFDLNGRLENLEPGQTIRILHATTDENGNIVSWEIYPTMVRQDGRGYYVEWTFEHLSPIAILRVTETGIVPDDPMDPAEPTTPSRPSTPSQDKNDQSIVATNGITSDRVNTALDGNEVFTDWTNENLSAERRSQVISQSFESELEEINRFLEDEDYLDELTRKQLRDLQAKQAILEDLADPDVKYELATLEDLDVRPGTTAPSEDNPITVRFNLNGKFEDTEEGQRIRILHLSEDGNVWEVYETTIKLDDGGFYAEWDFTHFSPVAVMRVTATGTNTDPIPEDPTVPTQPSIDNNTNGTITADQLADLIVKKLQQNADVASKAAIRTSGKASPKTGE